MVPVVVHHDAQMWQLQVQGEAGAWVKPKLASLISAGAIRIQGERAWVYTVRSHVDSTLLFTFAGPT